MLVNYNLFTENLSKTYLKYYAFDWDDNILKMPTKIHMENLVNGEWIQKDVSTEEFAKVRLDKENWRLGENPFSEFRDFGKRGDNAFLIDVKESIKNSGFGPSWNDFMKTLKGGKLFAIITARGHESDSIRKGIEYIINEILSERDREKMINNLYFYKDLFNLDSNKDLIKIYLDNCYFVGVSSPSFMERYGGEGGAESPEKLKIIALNNFLEIINKYGKQLNRKVKIGFSDDDEKNVESITTYFKEISPFYDKMVFYIYNTGKGKIKTKI